MKWLLPSCALAVALGAGSASLPAYSRPATPAATTTADCDPSGADRQTCLQEQRGVRIEQRRKGLVTPDPQTLQKNVRARCEPLPDADRQACLRRMDGEGTVSGTVEGGGLLRELVVVEKPSE